MFNFEKYFLRGEVAESSSECYGFKKGCWIGEPGDLADDARNTEFTTFTNSKSLKKL